MAPAVRSSMTFTSRPMRAMTTSRVSGVPRSSPAPSVSRKFSPRAMKGSDAPTLVRHVAAEGAVDRIAGVFAIPDAQATAIGLRRVSREDITKVH